METFASKVIDALGGTTAVSRLTEAPLSTVHSWRSIGIPKSRLMYLKLARPDLFPKPPKRPRAQVTPP